MKFDIPVFYDAKKVKLFISNQNDREYRAYIDAGFFKVTDDWRE